MDKRTAYRKKATQDATSVGFFMVFMTAAGSNMGRFTTKFLRIAFSHSLGRELPAEIFKIEAIQGLLSARKEPYGVLRCKGQLTTQCMDSSHLAN